MNEHNPATTVLGLFSGKLRLSEISPDGTKVLLTEIDQADERGWGKALKSITLIEGHQYVIEPLRGLPPQKQTAN